MRIPHDTINREEQNSLKCFYFMRIADIQYMEEHISFDINFYDIQISLSRLFKIVCSGQIFN